MTPQLSFRLQAADSSSPAHLSIGGELVPGEAEAERAAAAQQIADISQRGRVIFERDGAKLMRKGDWIMIKIHATERDDRDRLSPIVCWGRVAGTDLDSFGNEALSGVDHFARSIGRTINPAHLDAITRALHAEKRCAIGKPVAAMLLLAAAAAAVHHVTSKDTTSADHPAPTTSS